LLPFQPQSDQIISALIEMGISNLHTRSFIHCFHWHIIDMISSVPLIQAHVTHNYRSKLYRYRPNNALKIQTQTPTLSSGNGFQVKLPQIRGRVPSFSSFASSVETSINDVPTLVFTDGLNDCIAVL
jgi:hypothetical protein